MGAGEYRKGWGSSLGAGHMEDFWSAQQVQVCILQIALWQQWTGWTGRIKTRPGQKTTTGQDRDEHLHFDRRKDEHKDD